MKHRNEYKNQNPSLNNHTTNVIATMFKQNLQQKLLQKLSPQQIQLIKLLEVPTVQLEQRIKKEIEDNPLLEEGRVEEPTTENQEEAGDEGEDFTQEEVFDDHKDPEDDYSYGDYATDDDIPNYKLYANNSSPDDKRSEVPFAMGKSFNEYLKDQIELDDFTEHEKLLAEYIIGNIDEDGYLRRTLSSIVNDLAFKQNIKTSEEELKKILLVIQQCDPPGVGATDLRECLLLQLRRKVSIPGSSPYIKLAYDILDKFFDEYTKKHYEKIENKLSIKESDLKRAHKEVLRLNPKPGNSFNEQFARNINHHIIPDFVLDNLDGKLELSLNAKNAPELRISAAYANLLQNSGKDKKNRQDKEALTFVKQKLDSAKWFIDAIKQRQNTLLTTMNAIVEYQKEYFVEGDETKLHPMILKDIAEKTNLDISTISRVANSKFVQTHFGILPLKYFFSEGMQTENGDEVSTREIKKILEECIDNESKKRPLTDEKLSEILQEKGYLIARRTVAKYREQMNIPVARLRKQLQ